jgi:hypothetical protein
MYDDGGGSGGLWAAIGGGITLIIAAFINQMTKGSRKAANSAEVASLEAETDIIRRMREEIQRLSDRLGKVERELYDVRNELALEQSRVYRLKQLVEPDKLAEFSK